MAIKLVSTYSKKLGLPGYSSHSFGVTVETELIDLGEVQGESARIYELLQDAVDREIQHAGFIPADNQPNQNGDSHTRIGSTHLESSGSSPNGVWKCSDKQRDLILKVVDENGLDRGDVDHLARQRFGKGVKELSKIEASGLIDELLESHTNKNGGNGGSSPRRRPNAYAGGGR